VDAQGGFSKNLWSVYAERDFPVDGDAAVLYQQISYIFQTKKGRRMTTKLIGLTGKAGSGKDEVAKILWAEEGFTRIALADPLKQAASALFGLPLDHFNDRKLKEEVCDYWGMSPRTMLQKLGTACREVFGEGFFISRFSLSAGPLMKTDNIVVPDVRYDNEAEAFRRVGGHIVEVLRGPGLVGSNGNHPSEMGLSTLPDFTIDNRGSLEELEGKVIKLMESL